MKNNMKRKCIKCKKIVDWGAQIQEWMDFYGNDWVEYATVMIYCYKCETYTGQIDLTDGPFETEEIDSPVLKEKVLIPKNKK
jgi:hypothetical protein